MPLSQRDFRLVVQRTTDDRDPRFRIVAYAEGTVGVRSSELESLSALVGALASAGLEVDLDLSAVGSIIFAGEVEMDDSQLRALGLV